MPPDPIRIGVSSCLLGQRVRYDGGHKRDAFLTDVLGPQVEFVPVCPEVEIGLGTPREPMRLVRQRDALRMVTTDTGVDHSERLHAWAGPRLEALARENLSGYILKAKSPSCGVDGVRTFAPDGAELESDGTGLFAAALVERFPDLPVVDEARLADPAVREAFMRRVLEYGQRSLAPLRPVEVLRASEGSLKTASDDVAVEEPLEIRLHDRPFVVVMRTPGADRELAAGFLLSEGIITVAADLGAVEHCRHPARAEVHNVVQVFLAGPAAARLDTVLESRRNVLSNSSCGICGRLTIDALETRAQPLRERTMVSHDIFYALPETLRARQAVFDRTGGLHAAALCTADGALVTAAEDVGRHNAVDKVIGRMLFDERLPLTGCVLVVSGRASFEIVQKAWLAGIEVICAVSAPSSLAVELAVNAGITLIGFARERTFNVYTHPGRISSVKPVTYLP